MTHQETQVAVIGAGPGGYAAAFMAADLGLAVTLIDPDANPGGVCLYRGCIPSKALLHVARLIHEVRTAETMGLDIGEMKVDLQRLRSWKQGVVDRMTGGLGQLAKRKKISYLRGWARFENSNDLVVAHDDGSHTPVHCEHAIIATGSQPIPLPDSSAVSSEHLLDATGALDLAAIPAKLLVIGGGYIGLELGTVYAALGSKVEVAEMTANLLTGADKDLVRMVRKSLEGRFEAIHLETTVTRMKALKNGIKVTLSGPDGTTTDPRVFDKVLVAVGRRPSTEQLGLDKTRVERDRKGFIRIDAQCRTADKAIFAIGDVAGEPMLAHKATHQGRAAAEVIAGRDVTFDPAAIPAVVFTDPEVAWAGMTETQAKAQNIDHRIVRFPWAASGRAATLGAAEGLTKLIVERATERILGVGIVGVGAGELIAEGVLAIEMGAVVRDMGLTIHPHPTLSETLMEAADLFHGTATHYHTPKR